MLFFFSFGQAVHVFALEKEQSQQGQRIYLVTTYTELWHYYRSILSRYYPDSFYGRVHRWKFIFVFLYSYLNIKYIFFLLFFIRSYTKSLMHCYEVIPEGSVCKLYFDLEFHKPSNKEADGRAMVTSLIQVQFFPTWLLIKIKLCLNSLR